MRTTDFGSSSDPVGASLICSPVKSVEGLSLSLVLEQTFLSSRSSRMGDVIESIDLPKEKSLHLLEINKGKAPLTQAVLPAWQNYAKRFRLLLLPNST